MVRVLLILLISLSIQGCKKDGLAEECCPENPIDSIFVGSKDEPQEDSAVIRISESLEKSVDIEKNIKGIVTTNVELNSKNSTLQKTNLELKQELISTKDSLIKTKLQLKETLTKVPKKRSLFQRVLGTGKDSVEVKQIDTIQN